MKILVAIKDVEDPEAKVKVKPDGSGIETGGIKNVVNPFDEIAVEEALRLKETHGGEVAVVLIGCKDADQRIRSALALGADRGIHVVTDQNLDPVLVSKALQKVVEDEKPDLMMLGKQAVDDDQGQVGAMLAERLGWGQICFASKETSLESEEEKSKKPALRVKDRTLEALREIDGGLETVSAAMPVLVTTELRLNQPRYASLPNIMKAKKKPIKELPLSAVLSDTALKVKIVKMEAPPTRKGGTMVPDVPTLVQKLRSEAKVI